MKKLILLLVALCVGVLYNYADPTATTSENGTSSYSQATAQVYYDGLAYSAGTGQIPNADGQVSVYWTSDGCSVNGNPGYRVYKIDGGTFSMMVRGKYKEMTHYVSYGGERYFFQL